MGLETDSPRQIGAILKKYVRFKSQIPPQSPTIVSGITITEEIHDKTEFQNPNDATE